MQPRGTILDTIHDIVEFLRGRQTVSDTPRGKVSTRLTMYGFKWTVDFAVEDIGKNRSSVTIGIEGERRNKKKEIRSMFALLDSMLVGLAEIEYEESHAQAGPEEANM